MPFHTPLGIAFGLGAALSAAFGQTLQRRSLLDALKAGEEVPMPWKRISWVIGSVLYAVAGILDAISLVFAPMGVIVVLYALRLPMVALLATKCLGVSLTLVGAMGIFFCGAGAGLSLAFAPTSLSGYVLSHPSDLFTFQITIYVIISVCCCGLLAGCVSCEMRRPSSGLAGRVRGLAMPLLVAWTMNIEKLFNSAIGRLPVGDNPFSLEWLWLPSIVGLLMLVGGCMNFFALELQSTHTFVPLVFGFMAVFMSLQSFLFGEMQNMGEAGTFAWCTGIVATIFGTALISCGEWVEAPVSRSQVELPAGNRVALRDDDEEN